MTDIKGGTYRGVGGIYGNGIRVKVYGEIVIMYKYGVMRNEFLEKEISNTVYATVSRASFRPYIDRPPISKLLIILGFLEIGL